MTTEMRPLYTVMAVGPSLTCGITERLLASGVMTPPPQVRVERRPARTETVIAPRFRVLFVRPGRPCVRKIVEIRESSDGQQF